MKLPAYPRYKPSDVEWLGDVPEHWDIKSARFGFSIQLGKMLQPEASNPSESEVVYLKSQHVQWEKVRITELPTMWASRGDEVKYGIADGDLLVCEGGDVGRAGIVRNPPPRTIIQNALHRVRPYTGNDPRLLMYVLEHAASQGWFEILCNRATIAHFTGEKFGMLRIPIPSPTEQRSIADFLDRETAKLDTLVAKKRELIEKLKEKRTALISRAVTRGLNPAAKLKPSGIDWLGEIPEHWEMKAIKYAARVERGKFTHRPRNDPVMYDGPFPFIQTGDVCGAKKQIMSYSQTLSEEGRTVSKKFPANTIVMTIAANIGDVAILGFDAWFPDSIVGLIPESKTSTEFLFYLAVSLRPTFLRFATINTQLNINNEQIGGITVVVPPLPEQAAIASYLDRETAKIDRLVEKTESAVARLQEYRAALITAAVTGKIHVREAPHGQSGHDGLAAI